MIPKDSVFRSRKLLDHAEGQSCVRCGREDGTIVAAHYSGIGSAALGKGTGRKPSDAATAHLCRACHGAFDQYETPNDDGRSVAFLLLVVKTWDRLLRQGKVKV